MDLFVDEREVRIRFRLEICIIGNKENYIKKGFIFISFLRKLQDFLDSSMRYLNYLIILRIFNQKKTQEFIVMSRFKKIFEMNAYLITCTQS